MDSYTDFWEEAREYPEYFQIEVENELVLEKEFHGQDKWEKRIILAWYQDEDGSWINLEHILDEGEIIELYNLINII